MERDTTTPLPKPLPDFGRSVPNEIDSATAGFGCTAVTTGSEANWREVNTGLDAATSGMGETCAPLCEGKARTAAGDATE